MKKAFVVFDDMGEIVWALSNVTNVEQAIEKFLEDVGSDKDWDRFLDDGYDIHKCEVKQAKK